MNARACAAGVALALTLACTPGPPVRGPVVDTGNRPDNVGGTISGGVTAGGAPLSGRRITAVNTATGAKFETSTAAAGGYTIKVPAGTYRLEVELRAGETVQTQPSATDVNVGDLDAGRDFVLSR